MNAGAILLVGSGKLVDISLSPSPLDMGKRMSITDARAVAVHTRWLHGRRGHMTIRALFSNNNAAQKTRAFA